MIVTVENEDCIVTINSADGHIETDTGGGAGTKAAAAAVAEGHGGRCDTGIEIPPEDRECFDIVSELADVCEYLEKAEIIKIRLIIAKCMERKGGDVR